MIIDYLVSKTLFDRILGGYEELDKTLALHPSASADKIKDFVGEHIRQVRLFRDEVLAGGEVRPDMHEAARKMKLELRSAQRTWQRHLVTEARVRRLRNPDYFSPNFAA